MDFNCVYKNDSETIRLSMSGEFGETWDTFPISYSILVNNKDTYKTYPANYISKFEKRNGNVDYDAIGGGNYFLDKNNILACPKKISAIYLDGAVVQNIVRFNNEERQLAFVFFSEDGYLIKNNELTNQIVYLNDLTYIDGEDEGLMKLSDFQESKYEIKEFTLSKENSSSENIETPPTIDNEVQYCYYKNSCGEVVELTFYKYTAHKESVFNNGKKLLGWEKDNCPTSIVVDNQTYTGKTSSCTGSGSVKNCYNFLKSYSEKQELISEGNCSNVSDDPSSVSIRYLSLKGNNKITVEYVNSEVSNKKFRIIDNNMTKTVTNPDEFASVFNNKDEEQYPTYLIKYDDKYTFINSQSKIKENIKSSVEVYILSSKIYQIFGNNQSKADETCLTLFGTDFLKFLNNNVFKILYIGVFLTLIVLTTFDFAKAVFKDDKDANKSAFNKFKKRIIVTVLIYLVPTTIIFLTNTLANNEVQQCSQFFKNYVETNEN